MAIAGRVAIVPKGDWSADATYNRLDAVTYNNALFIARKEVPVGILPTNIEYWMKSIDGSQTIPNATKTQDGLMSKEDKTKLDGFKQYKPDGETITADEDGTLHGVAEVTVDTDLSSTSTNPVQNKVVKGAVDELNQNLGVERARIDSLTKLPEGSTTGDAELQDIRVKADGTTATSAGNAVREQFSELKEDLVNYEMCAETFASSSSFKRGYLNNGSIITAVKYRVCSENIITAKRDICLQSTSDYKFLIAYFVDGTYEKSTDWTQYLIVPKGTTFRLQIAKYTEDTSITADIDEFVNQVKFCDTDRYAIDTYYFNEIKWISGEFVNIDGTIGLSSSYSRSEFIEIPKSLDSKITVYASATGKACSIAFYDSNKNFVSQYTTYSSVMTVDIPDNAVYFRVTNNPSVISSPYIYVKKKISIAENFTEIRKIKYMLNCIVNENEKWR